MGSSVFDFYTKKIKVFVGEVPDTLTDLRNRLIQVMVRAGMDVLFIDTWQITDQQKLYEETKRLMNMADCSIHILGNASSENKTIDRANSISDYQLKEAQERIKSEWREFKIFIWQPFDMPEQSTDEQYDNYINSLRQGIIQNMVYSNRKSDILFIEDIRSVMYGGKPEEFDIDKTDLFFIYNLLDRDFANEIITLVADVISTRVLEIDLSKEIDYAELVAQQIIKSKVVAIYYNNTADWALPFVQQVWKKIGGASSPTPILFIGDANNDSNSQIEFEAPKVISINVAHEIMPVEIKVQYDKLCD